MVAGLMEASQMLVDIDGDVLVFLELAQVRVAHFWVVPVLPGGLSWPAGDGCCCTRRGMRTPGGKGQEVGVELDRELLRAVLHAL